MRVLELQPTTRFALGDTYYLPKPSDNCDGATWSLVEAPSKSEAQVFSTGTSHPRFTPDVAGDYRFRLKGELTATLSVETRAPKERFRNHYLTPLYGAAKVGEQLWVANGAAYTVTRVVQRDGRWSKLDEVTVGAWPAAIAWAPGLDYALVAQRGADSIGFIHRERAVLEDSLWVGDEPAAVVVGADGQVAYVSLPVDREVAVIDVTSRQVVDRIVVGFDPRAMVLSRDGALLYVAAYRSRSAERDWNGTYGPLDDQDLWVIDTKTRQVSAVWGGISSNLRAITLSPEDDELFVAGTHSNPVPSQGDLSADPLSFVHEAIAIDAASGEVRARADLGRQESSQGAVVNASGILATDSRVWVAAESSSVVVELDRETLKEVARYEVGLGARQLLWLGGDQIAVHNFADFTLSILERGGSSQQVQLTEDPRSREIALGERVFMRPGFAFAEHHSCSSCHTEAQNEGQIWHFGGDTEANVRPLQLLLATTPNGWTGYTSNAANFGYQGPGSIVRRPVEPEEAEGLAAFLGSLIGAPRANSHTELDGSYTPAGLRGKALFEGRAQCSTCHTPPLYTNRSIIAEGKSGVAADVPTLLGAYRHGIYFLRGMGRSIGEAVDVAVAYVGVSLTAEEREDLVAFLNQLTVKSAAPLGMWPDIDTAESVYPDVEPWVEFSELVQGPNPEIVAAEFVSLVDGAGAEQPGSIKIAGNRISFAPDVPLSAGRTYRFVVKAGLPFANATTQETNRESQFRVRAQAPAVELPDRLLFTVSLMSPMGVQDVPFLLDGITPAPGAHRLTISPMLFATQQRQSLWARMDGETFTMAPFAIPVRPGGGVADARDIRGRVVGDGSEWHIEGSLTLSAPGFEIPDIPFVASAASADTLSP